MALRFEVAHQTYVGKARVGSPNEDAVGVYVADGQEHPNNGVQALFCVADGMGGGHAGEVASQKILQGMMAYLADGRLAGFAESRGISPDSTPHLVKEAVVLLNGELNRFAAAQGKRMGATLEAVLMRHDAFCLAHAGDSRTYLIRDGRIEQLTEDHSAVEALVRMNVPREQAVQMFGSNVVTNILGVQPVVQVDVIEGPVQADDCFVMCTDGLTSHVPPRDIVGAVTGAPTVQDACDELVRTANERDGTDNITVLLARAAAQA